MRQQDIVRHIYEFYIQLMGSKDEPRARLRADVWDPALRVTDEENEGLGLAFLPEEIGKATLGMKSDTAPGPDGWPVKFFKKF